MKLSITAGIIGTISILLMWPLSIVSVEIVGDVTGCSSEPNIWFCGSQGYFIGPAIAIFLAVFALKYFQVPRWALVALSSYALMLVALFGYAKEYRTIDTPGIQIFFGMALLAGLLFAALATVFNHTSRARRAG